MNKRQLVDQFRQTFPDLPIPSDLRKVRIGYALRGPSQPFMGHQRLRTTAVSRSTPFDGSTPHKSADPLKLQIHVRRFPKNKYPAAAPNGFPGFSLSAADFIRANGSLTSCERLIERVVAGSANSWNSARQRLGHIAHTSGGTSHQNALFVGAFVTLRRRGP